MKMLRLFVTFVLSVVAYVTLMICLVTFARPALVWLIGDGTFLDRLAFVVGFGSVSIAMGMGLADVALALIFDHYNRRD